MKQIFAACMMFLIASTGLMAQNTETKFVKAEKEKCKANYKLAAVNATAKEAEGFLLLQFDFDFEKNSDIPENGELLVKLVNCKGQKVHVKVGVKFDSATGKAYLRAFATRDLILFYHTAHGFKKTASEFTQENTAG